MLNLIVNAIQSMSGVENGNRELHISTVSIEPEGVRVAVRDTGHGLRPESLPRLFEPFYTTKPDGMGMGLSICRSIIEAHGGRPGASRGVPSFSLRSPLTELSSVIDVAYWHLGTTLRMSTSTGNLLTPVPSNTHSHHTFAPPRRRLSRFLAAELAGHGSAECLRVDRECRRRCDHEPS
jgi:Histidine kinase-, DNA gyrase B-, and HSP90-like ATPase